MHLHDDGDMIRGLGFIALYSAYVEEQIDACLDRFIENNLIDQLLRKAQSSVKIKELKKQVEMFGPLPNELLRFPDCLDHVRDLLEKRNEFLHGRIYFDRRLGDIRKSGRVGVPDTYASSLELFRLANDLSSITQALMAAADFKIPRLLNKSSP